MPMGEHLKLDMGLVKNGSDMRPQYISFMTFSQAISGFWITDCKFLESVLDLGPQ